MCLIFTEEQKKKWFTHEKDDVNKNRLPELTETLKNKMRKRMECSDEDMKFWYIALALQCTRIYVKYHLDDEKRLNELKERYANHPIIGLPFKVVWQFAKRDNVGEALRHVNQVAYNDAVSTACTIIQCVNDIGLERYGQYGLMIPEKRFSIDEDSASILAEFLTDWALSRTKKADDIGTLFDLIICAFYYLMHRGEYTHHSLAVNTIIIYSNSVASYSDYFWTGDNMKYSRMEGILNMPADEFVERVDRLFCNDSFIREVFVEYCYVTNHGHSGTLL